MTSLAVGASTALALLTFVVISTVRAGASVTLGVASTGGSKFPKALPNEEASADVTEAPDAAALSVPKEI